MLTERLGLIVSVQLRNVLEIPVLLNVSLLYKFDIRIKSAEISLCFPEFTYNSTCHNEIITVLLFCDLSCKVQGRDDLTCCCSSFLYIKDNSREGSCSCCFSKQACG